jgi:STE24 endopeptidase
VAALPDAWWAVYAAIGSLAFAVLTFVAPYVLVPLFYRIRPLEDEQVVGVVRRLAAAARTEIRSVGTLDFSRKTAEANAAVIGLGRSRRVVLADTLLREFPLPEVASVVAHELGHHVHRDVPRVLGIQATLLLVGGLLAERVGPALLELAGAPPTLADPASFPLLLLGAELFGLVTLPLTNLASRRIETAADRFALRLTRDRDAFVSAMERLARQNLADPRPPRWAEIWLYSHPPVWRRIRMAEAER